MATGSFKIKPDGADKLEFNIEPDPNVSGPVPDDQSDLQHDIYAAIGVLKYLHEQKAFNKQEATYDDFRRRLLQAARVGLEGADVKTRLAVSAVEQIAGEVVVRVGKKVQIHYLGWLLVGVAVGVVAGLIIQGYFPGYGAVVAASMVGAWISVAASRRKIALVDLPQFIDSKYEPPVRLFFVALVACAVALFVRTGLLSIVIGSLNLAEFQTNPEAAAVLGLLAGISERTISLQLIQKAQQAIPSS